MQQSGIRIRERLWTDMCLARPSEIVLLDQLLSERNAFSFHLYQAMTYTLLLRASALASHLVVILNRRPL
jgi:hypothetical protein